MVRDRPSVSDLERFATLETKLSNVGSLLSDIARQMTEVQMLAQHITRMQERQEKQSEGLDRAFKAIDGVKDETRGFFDASLKDRAEIKSRLMLWSGGLAVLVFISSGLQAVWWRSEDEKIARIKRMEQIITDSERRLTIMEARSPGYRVLSPKPPELMP